MPGDEEKAGSHPASETICRNPLRNPTPERAHEEQTAGEQSEMVVICFTAVIYRILLLLSVLASWRERKEASGKRRVMFRRPSSVNKSELADRSWEMGPRTPPDAVSLSPNSHLPSSIRRRVQLFNSSVVSRKDAKTPRHCCSRSRRYSLAGVVAWLVPPCPTGCSSSPREATSRFVSFASLRPLRSLAATGRRRRSAQH